MHAGPKPFEKNVELLLAFYSVYPHDLYTTHNVGMTCFSLNSHCKRLRTLSTQIIIRFEKKYTITRVRLRPYGIHKRVRIGLEYHRER